MMAVIKQPIDTLRIVLGYFASVSTLPLTIMIRKIQRRKQIILKASMEKRKHGIFKISPF